MQSIREAQEALEEQSLSPYAALSGRTRGRRRPVASDGIRTEYQRDRDRILHCNSFRRLKDKTQMLLSPQGDHYRTRLTHTLEVAQIARTIARALRLNEDLTEAIALGHDLGHTPFGHAGERALNQVAPHGFVHSYQSVRVVDHLENNGKGLNLTLEVKNGIALHSDKLPRPMTLEGQTVRISDKIAYINHDIEDAVRAGILREDQLPYDCLYVLGRTKRARITTLIRSIVEHSGASIEMAPEVLDAHTRLKRFMFDEIYTDPMAKGEEGKAEGIVQTLYRYFLEHPRALPEPYSGILQQQSLENAVCDYIAGMTDQFAVELYKDLYVPKFWTR